MHTRTRRAVVAASIGVAVVAVGIGIWWAAAREDAPLDAAPSASSTASPASSPSLSASPTTPVQTPDPTPRATPAPAPGTGPVAPVPADPPGAAAPVSVDVVTTFSGWNSLSGALEVGAYVSVVEAPGTCTLVLEGPAGTVTRQVAGVADASTVSCVVSVPGAEVAPGTWRATMSYASAASAGAGATMEVAVP